MEIRLTYSDQVAIFLQRQNKTKGWLCQQLGITGPTLKARLTDNNWRLDQVEVLKNLGIVL